MGLNTYCFLLILVATLAESRGGIKRELPLSLRCDPRISGSCSKADLVSKDVADCNIYRKNSDGGTCKPINAIDNSSNVDVPDVKSGPTCIPVSGTPIRCGSGYDTRCVCEDKGPHYKKRYEIVTNECRCQYWPEVDIRRNKPSYCTLYDHGGESNVMFVCCNNCNDQDFSCSGQTYQSNGAGSNGNEYCSSCGVSNAAGGGRIAYRFNCVSCNQQEKCRNKCNKCLPSVPEMRFPHQCDGWTECFRDCCTEADSDHLKRQTTIDGTVGVGEFCGDKICQTGEDELNCPADC